MSNVAAGIIEKCGGHATVAEICGVHITRVYRWTYPVEKGGCGGLVPTRHQALLLKGARERGIDLRPDHFFEAADLNAQVPVDRSGEQAVLREAV